MKMEKDNIRIQLNMSKNMKKYTYDDLMDKYNETGYKDLLTYCLFKKNDMNVEQMSKLLNVGIQETFLFIFNIQQVMDDKPLAKYFNDIFNIVQQEIDLNNEIDDDDDDDDLYI